ncbi:hypothetical protein NO1_0176 [Candidatus Termititenax aidoneus]|uniref:Uncharacterized protein n=1 Tax=Termititenax aidoneus TaxID=2218524 RepID=A0A388T8J2_TERA1|nr:hypothetical protein NO1_0176 [Candidatus Termititenax aidoneus]
MLALTQDEKLDIMKTLNWDYAASPEDMLAVVDGQKARAGNFDQERLFVRSLERLSWHRLVALWGVEKIKALYTPQVAHRLRSPDFRREYVFAVGILRGEPVSVAGWGSERSKQLQNLFLSDRWHRN